jgi:hypothetical protein
MNQIQKLQFELMKLATFNGYDGERVVKSLEKHEDLWRGVVMDRADYCFHGKFGQNDDGEKIDLIKLRDIQSDCWNVDTVFVLPETGKEDELYKLAKRWGADEVDWIGGQHAGSLLGATALSNEKQILRVWWD